MTRTLLRELMSLNGLVDLGSAEAYLDVGLWCPIWQILHLMIL
jgi:hypothetical protein